MKSCIMLCITVLLYAVTAAQYNTVTIQYGGQNRQVIVDGKTYTPNAPTSENANANARLNAVIINDLAPGSHRLQVVRNNNRANVSTTFNLRNNYDLEIKVQGNGSIQLKETYRKRYVNDAMSAANFNALVRLINSKRITGERVILLNNAFTNTSNYFTSNQVKRLLQLVPGEANRLGLAKTSYRSVVDRENFNTINTLFSVAGRRELALYVSNYAGTTIPDTKAAMSNSAFTTMFNDIRNRWQPGAKYTGVTDAFNGENYFTVSQAVQLVQLMTSEAERLELAKLSYKTIVDPSNFNRMFALLANQTSKDDLAYYVRTYAAGQTNPPISNTAMTSTAFSLLLEDIRGRWLPGAKKAAVLEVLANTNNYFTVSQVVQLVQTDNDESDRLEMAKASLRSIVDPANMQLLYNVFTTTATRNELINYVRSYNAGTINQGGTTNTYRTPMSAAEFSNLYNETRNLWLPGATKSAVLNAFTRANTFYTVQQARQLISLDNDEDDRLDMAKAGYRVLADPQNISQMYDLFTNQTYLTEFKNYITSNPL